MQLLNKTVYLFGIDLMLPGVAITEAGDEMKKLEKGQVCAIALVGNRYVCL